MAQAKYVFSGLVTAATSLAKHKRLNHESATITDHSLLMIPRGRVYQLQCNTFII